VPLFELYTAWQQQRAQRQRLLAAAAAAAADQQQAAAAAQAATVAAASGNRGAAPAGRGGKVLTVPGPTPAAAAAAAARAAQLQQQQLQRQQQLLQMRPVELFYSKIRVSGCQLSICGPCRVPPRMKRVLSAKLPLRCFSNSNLYVSCLPACRRRLALTRQRPVTPGHYRSWCRRLRACSKQVSSRVVRKLLAASQLVLCS